VLVPTGSKEIWVRPPLDTFTEPGMAIGPVAHILSNVMYIYELSEWQAPAQVQERIYDWQYMWGAGVEMAFLAAHGFRVWHQGVYSHQDFLEPKNFMLRGLVGDDYRTRHELFSTPESVAQRQELTLQYMHYFEQLQGTVLYRRQRVTHKAVNTALSRGMVVDLAWGRRGSPDVMAALAYGFRGNDIKVYCPYWDKQVLRTFTQEEFLSLWRGAYGINVYQYEP
jgi:nucleoside-specific outer membrane channel protein Tsx